MRLLTAIVTAATLAAPAKADAKKQDCNSRACVIRVADRQCSQTNPKACVRLVVHRRRLTGALRAWMWRVPGCESGWNPYAYNGAPFNRRPTSVIYGPPEKSAGLFQFMPSTWRTTPYGHRWIWSARWQARAAAWMLTAGRSGEWTCV